MSLFKKLLLFSIILTSLPLFVIGAISYKKTEATTASIIRNYTNMALLNELDAIDMYLGEIASVAYSVSNSDRIRQLINRDGIYAQMDSASRKKKARELLYELSYSRVYINDIYVFTSDEVLSTNYFEQNVAAIESCDWYQNMKTQRIGLHFLGQGSVPSAVAPGVVTVARPLSGVEPAQAGGIVVVEMESSTMFDKLSRLHITENSDTFLFDALGNVVYPSGSPYASLYDLRPPNDAAVIRAVSEYSGWTLVSIIPQADFLRDAKAQWRYTFAITLLCAFAAIVFCVLFSRYISQPIVRLSAAMKQVENGDLSIRAQVMHNDEVSALTVSFNSMVSKIDRLIQENYIAKLQQRKAELVSLQAQINPHFIYNTLVSIKWEAMKNNDLSVSSRITALVTLLQLSVNKGNLFITLKDEITMLKKYVELLEPQLNGRVRIYFEVDPALENFILPKLTLQPLVENAILHGILERNGSGSVWICAQKQQHDVVFIVRDDGIGMPPQLRDNLFSKKQTDSLNGFGLQNVLERLDLHYKDAVEIFVESEPLHGTTITITLKNTL